MKRRNADCGKLRRPVKRNKITENIYGSTFVYVKFLLVWAVVLLADFIVEFRFEYLWPFWLLLRSFYDSFKYQGLAFSVFFICIALTSDMMCFLFIPVHWLLFAASTFVWVQYIWHTERGICLPTVSLWLLFVYIEASVRLKEIKNLPFHLDLCRPFAAHCIGYPVVTLGFGFKSYVGYKMRQRKQKEVAKENDFYMQLLLQALPTEQQQAANPSPEKSAQSSAIEDATSDNISASNNSSSSNGKVSASSPVSVSHSKSSDTSIGGSGNNSSSSNNLKFSDAKKQRHHVLCNGSSNGGSNNPHYHNNPHSSIEKELQYMESNGVNGSIPCGGSNNSNNNNSTNHHSLQHHHKRTNINDYDENNDLELHDKSFKANGVIHKNNSSGGSISNSSSGSSSSSSRSSSSLSSGSSPNQAKDNSVTVSVQPSTGKRNKNSSSSSSTAKESSVNNLNSQRDDHVIRLEADIKRLKADLQASRQTEQELSSQINSLTAGERSTKNELMQLQQDNENLQSKLHGLVTARQQDKQTVSSLEKKLQEERKCRSVIESQLSAERKNKKAEEAAARAAALASANSRAECTESCKARRRELESDNKQLRRDLKVCEERLRQAEREAQTLRQYKDSHSEAEVLMSALSAMQDKNAHLENSLSAETRLKLDLFSALGEAKRQLEITQSLVLQREKEIEELKSKIAEVMAVMPPTTFSGVNLDSNMISPPLYSSKFIAEEKITNSTLDPNALVYTPKGIVTAGSVMSTVTTADL